MLFENMKIVIYFNLCYLITTTSTVSRIRAADVLLKFYDLDSDLFYCPRIRVFFKVRIRTAGKDFYQGLDSNLRNYLYQKRKEVFVVNIIESDSFLVVLRLGVVVPTVTFCNYCRH